MLNMKNCKINGFPMIFFIGGFLLTGVMIMGVFPTLSPSPIGINSNLKNAEFLNEDLQEKDFQLDEILINFPVSAEEISTFEFSTLFGDTGTDKGYSMAIDNLGYIYITGVTGSSNFPTTTGAINETYTGGGIWGYDIYICKISPDGTELIYSTLLGGIEDDFAKGIAVDSSGCAYVTGYTQETGFSNKDFPTTSGAYDEIHNDRGDDDLEYDAFVCKINEDGTDLVYSTYIGGSDNDYGYGITVDESNYAYVTGYTGSPNFPTTSGAFNQTFSSGFDAFVCKINPDGSQLTNSSFIGSSGNIYGRDIILDESGCVYITGETGSSNFPTTEDAINRTLNGAIDAFVCKISADGTELLNSTYLGGAGDDYGRSIALDNSGNTYITGYTEHVDTRNFPTTPGVINPIHNDNDGDTDVFVCKINSQGTELTYSTFLGGGGNDYGYGIAIDSSGSAYITGSTCDSASPFPTTLGALDQTYNGGSADSFVCKISADATEIEYSTFLGSSADTNDISIAMMDGQMYIRDDGFETGWDIAVDGQDSIFVIGETYNGTFNSQTTSGVINETHNGGYDIYLGKISLVEDLPINASFIANATNIIEGHSVEFTFTGLKGDEPSVLQWNFGDSPSYLIEVNPIHIFERAGTFEVMLSITDKYGELNYTTMMIVVDERPPEGGDNMIYAYIFAPINVIGILVGLYFIQKKK
jgi:hypothetical protein